MKSWLKKIFDYLPNNWQSQILSWNRIHPPICHDVKTYPKLNLTSIYPAQIINRKIPHTLEPDIHPLFLKYLTWDIPEKYLTIIPQAQLIGSDGLLILPNGQFALELAWHESLLQNYPAYYTRLRPPLVYKKGAYYSLMLLWCRTYYHWFHDVILRLYLILEKLPKDIIFIVPSDLTQNQLDSLKFLGISEQQLSYFTGEQVWKLEYLFYSPPTTLTAFDLPAANNWLRKVFWEKCHISSPKNSQRIYISRKLAKRGRQITNETEVESCLQNYGFVTYLMESMSLSEQVSLFSKAEIVVSPHGAGLTNLLFAPDQTKVLEIFEPTIIRQCYWSICEAMGYDYWYLLGNTQVIMSQEENSIYVPIDKLEKTIKIMLNNHL